MRLIMSSTALPWVFAVVLPAFACSGSAVSMSDLQAIDLQEERLLQESASGLGLASDFRVVVQESEEIVLMEAGSALSETLDATGLGLVDATALASGELLVATEGDLRVWVDGTLEPTALGEAVGTTVRRLESRGEVSWLLAGGHLHRYQAGQVQTLTVGGAALGSTFALGPGPEPDLWVATADGLVGLDGVTFEAFEEQPGMVVDGLGIDARGEVVVASEGDLWHRDPDKGRWRRTRADVAILDVSASAEAVGHWVLTEGPLLRLEEGELFRSELTPESGAVARTDALGRLVLADDTGVRRLGRSRAVAVVGLEDGDVVESSTEVLLAPSQLGELASLGASVDGTAVAVDLDAGTALIDTSGLTVGEAHTFEASATWADGVEARSVALSFTVDRAGDVSWDTDIEPLFEARCAICHGGDSETQLDTPEAWEARMDTILALVSAGSMPIGSDPLTEGQIATIEAWRDGGYP